MTQYLIPTDSFLMAVSISRASIAAIMTVLLYIVSFLPFVILLLAGNVIPDAAFYIGVWFSYQKGQLVPSTSSHNYLQNLLMSTSFSFGALYLTRFEQQALGLSWDRIWTSPLGEEDPLNFGVSSALLLADAVLYGLLAISILLSKLWLKNLRTSL